MAYNLDLMRAVREQITKHPETHDQTSWGERTECGTTHCIAGWACALNGDALLWESDDEDDDGRRLETASMLDIEDGWITIPERAQEILGLDNAWANQLFFESSEDQALAKLDELIKKGERAA